MVTDYAHQTVLLAESLEALAARPGGRWVDGTVGGGGHAQALLERSSPSGWLLGCDRDGAALAATAERLAPFTGRFELRHGNFADLGQWVEPASCDGVLLDLGVSSFQLDRPERGFSFQQEGPLDMRMDPRQALTAARVVNEANVEELAGWLRDLGGEREARGLARMLARERERTPFVTTSQLADCVARWRPRGGRAKHPATQLFLTLRLVVNAELESLARGLEAAWTVLKPGGRLAVISFHSSEDRVVKRFGRNRERDYEVIGPVDVPELRRPRAPELRRVCRKAIRPGAIEVARNPRARSAQLRVMERL